MTNIYIELPLIFNIPLKVVLFENIAILLTLNVVNPDTFNDDKQVELFCKVVLPVTYKLPNAVLLNNVVDVALRLDIFNVEFVDNEFKLLNIVVLVAFKLFIPNIELVDNEFKLLNIVVLVAFKLFIDNVEFVDNAFKLLNIVVDVAFKLFLIVSPLIYPCALDHF